MKNSDMPAMPHTEYDKDGNLPAGLTKREYFSGLAMQSILAADTEQSYTSESIAREAIQVADALLAALEQEQAK